MKMCGSLLAFKFAALCGQIDAHIVDVRADRQPGLRSAGRRVAVQSQVVDCDTLDGVPGVQAAEI